MGCDGDGIWTRYTAKDPAEETLTSGTSVTHRQVICGLSALTVSGFEGHESSDSESDESADSKSDESLTDADEQLPSGEVDAEVESENTDVDMLPKRSVTARVSESVAAGTAINVAFKRIRENSENAFISKRLKKKPPSYTICVTVPFDHFGPITAEDDPIRNQGVLVGEIFVDRFASRKWGAHFPVVACIGFAGQSNVGAQSVALSGGYEDDEDHGDWFLFTGSGAHQDQKFEERNEAVRVSCEMGYPVRVVRSFRQKRSAYTPLLGVRYDGIYRIEKCWRKLGLWGYIVCRYLFVRCDNEPAPWNRDRQGDLPRPLPNIAELEMATDLFERKESPSWDFDEVRGRWRWMKPPPASKRSPM